MDEAIESQDGPSPGESFTDYVVSMVMELLDMTKDNPELQAEIYKSFMDLCRKILQKAEDYNRKRQLEANNEVADNKRIKLAGEPATRHKPTE